MVVILWFLEGGGVAFFNDIHAVRACGMVRRESSFFGFCWLWVNCFIVFRVVVVDRVRVMLRACFYISGNG